MTNGTCPIWGTPAKIHHRFEDGSGRVDSPRAGGLYVVDRETKDDYLENPNRLKEQIKARLTTWLVEQRQLGVDCPKVTFEAIADAKQRKALAVHERADRLLLHIRNEVHSIGKNFCFSKQYLDENIQSWKPDETFMRMKAWSESVEDADIFYLLGYLDEEKFITRMVVELGQHSQGPYRGRGDYFEYQITPHGHAHLAALEKKAVDSKQAFVAMWFDDSLAAAYEDGIAPAVRDAGYEPLRIDRKDHNNRIDDEIIAEIRRSRFVVADFTHGDSGPRGGVYYEAGFAHGEVLNLLENLVGVHPCA